MELKRALALRFAPAQPERRSAMLDVTLRVDLDGMTGTARAAGPTLSSLTCGSAVFEKLAESSSKPREAKSEREALRPALYEGQNTVGPSKVRSVRGLGRR
ncbi:MAG: hypothetical protein HY901_22255 [Deltaproteobacteria bacterium]|nr:hypothetical protein [Deltaproteobacteria bacterium]